MIIPRLQLVKSRRCPAKTLMVIFDDADLDAAVANVTAGLTVLVGFTNTGMGAARPAASGRHGAGDRGCRFTRTACRTFS